ncbi:MAG: hypothetical protein R3C28_20910 [Pirellulaceae bacterium]
MDSTTLRIALRQQLESLVRSGVQQGPRINPALWQTLVESENVVTTAVSSESAPSKSAPAAAAPPAVRKSTDTAPAAPIAASATATSSGGATGQVPANLSTLTHDSWQTPSVDRESRIRLLAEIDQEVKACEKCSILSSNRTQTVFGVGNVMARLCFFGEGPGATKTNRANPSSARRASC